MSGDPQGEIRTELGNILKEMAGNLSFDENHRITRPGSSANLKENE